DCDHMARCAFHDSAFLCCRCFFLLPRGSVSLPGGFPAAAFPRGSDRFTAPQHSRHRPLCDVHWFLCLPASRWGLAARMVVSRAAKSLEHLFCIGGSALFRYL